MKVMISADVEGGVWSYACYLATELVRAIRTADYPAPQGNCGFTRIVG